MANMLDSAAPMVPPIRWKTPIPLRHMARAAKMAVDDEEDRRRRNRVQALQQDLAFLKIRNKFDKRLQDLGIFSMPEVTSTHVRKPDVIYPSSMLLSREPGRVLSSVDSRILATRRLLWPRHSPFCWRRGYCSCSQNSHSLSYCCNSCASCTGMDLPLDAEPLESCCCKWSFPTSDFARRLWMGMPRKDMSFTDPDELMAEKRRKSILFRSEEECRKKNLAEREYSTTHQRRNGRQNDAAARTSTLSRSDSKRIVSDQNNGRDDYEEEYVQRRSVHEKTLHDSQKTSHPDFFHHGNSLRSVFASHPEQIVAPSVRKYSLLLQQSLQEAREELAMSIAEPGNEKAEPFSDTVVRESRSRVDTPQDSDEDSSIGETAPRRPYSGYQPVSVAVIKLRALLCKANTLTAKYKPVHAAKNPTKGAKPGTPSKSPDVKSAKTDSKEDNSALPDRDRRGKGRSQFEGEESEDDEAKATLVAEVQESLTESNSDDSGTPEETEDGKVSQAPLALRSSLKPRNRSRFSRVSAGTAKAKSVTFASDIQNSSNRDSAVTSRLSSPRRFAVQGRGMDSNFHVALLDLAVRRRIQHQLQDQERGLTNFRLPITPRAPSDPMALLRHSQDAHLQRLGVGSTYIQRMRRSEPLSLRTAMTRASAKSRKY